MSKAKRKHFIELCLDGDACPEDISRFVQEWREKDSTESLEEYLGMTGAEYNLWMEDSGNLKRIIAERASMQPGE